MTDTRVNTVPARKMKLYLFRCGDLFKIGVSADIGARLRSLSAHTPDVLHRIHDRAFRKARSLERALHCMFKHKHRYGEWFTLDDDDVAFIKGIDSRTAETIMSQAVNSKVGRHKKKDPACASNPTITVKVSRKLGEAIAEVTHKKKVDASAYFGPQLDTWIAGLLKGMKPGCSAAAVVDRRPRGEKPDLVIVRLWRSQILKLKYISIVRGRTLNSMIEEKLWELLA